MPDNTLWLHPAKGLNSGSMGFKDCSRDYIQTLEQEHKLFLLFCRHKYGASTSSIMELVVLIIASREP